MVTEGSEALQVALAHLFFNLTGIAIFYPIPYMRRIPLYLATQLGRATRLWRGFPFDYIAVMFFMLPLVFLGISIMFEQDSTGLTVLGSFIVIILSIGLIYTVYYCQYKGGKQNCIDCLGKREVKRQTMADLPDDMVYLKSVVAGLMEHTGYVPEEPVVEEKIEKKVDELVANGSGHVSAETESDADGEHEAEA